MQLGWQRIIKTESLKWIGFLTNGMKNYSLLQCWFGQFIQYGGSFFNMICELLWGKDWQNLCSVKLDCYGKAIGCIAGEIDKEELKRKLK
jgi:hypothetical protein